MEAVILFGFWEIFMFCERALLIDFDGTVNEPVKMYLFVKQSG
jgi:hypothetical protein